MGLASRVGLLPQGYLCIISVIFVTGDLVLTNRRKVNVPKLKTNRGAKKRIKITGGNKLLHGHAYSNHFLAKKSSSRKRRYSKDAALSKPDAKNMKKALGA